MVEKCAVDGCGRARQQRGWCHKHYERWRTLGDPCFPRTNRPAGAGTLLNSGYRRIGDGTGRRPLEHRLVAEKALGKALPPRAVVHHVDGSRANNEGSNLVICPSHAYHHLLHIRQAAIDACGHADWRKCRFCGVYSPPGEIVARDGDNFHRICMRKSWPARVARERAAGKRP